MFLEGSQKVAYNLVINTYQKSKMGVRAWKAAQIEFGGNPETENKYTAKE